MYINFKLASEKRILPEEIIALQLIQQNKGEDLSEIIEKYLTTDLLDNFQDQGYIEYVKAKTKADKSSKLIRLSSKGKDLLRDLQTYKVLPEDITVFEWLRNLYLGLGKEIGSEKKCKELIAWFRQESGISKNSLITLLRIFTEDEDRMEYSKVLQYVFWTQSHRYQKDPALEDSKLWLYYEKYREKFDKLFEKYE